MFVLFVRFDENLSKEKLLPIMDKLPSHFVQEVSHLKKLKDQYAKVLGRFLLLEGLIKLNCNSKLEELSYTEYGRPYLTNEVDFSISHSDEVVTCAISDICQVGIDIEKNTIVDELGDYCDMFTRRDWNSIILEGQLTFYEYWTKKEAIMKGDGRGISTAFADLEVTSRDEFFLENQKWYVTKLELFDDYTCHLACNIKNVDIKIIEKHSNDYLLTG